MVQVSDPSFATVTGASGIAVVEVSCAKATSTATTDEASTCVSIKGLLPTSIARTNGQTT